MKTSKQKLKTQKSQSGRNDLAPSLSIVYREPKDLHASEHLVREIQRAHIDRVKNTIQTFGFSVPVLVRGDEIVDGRIRQCAAIELDFEKIPCIDTQHLNKDMIRALRLSVNKAQEGGKWNVPALKLEFEHLHEFNTDLSITGFEAWEIDGVLEIRTSDETDGPADHVPDLPDPNAPTICQPGETWKLGDHFIRCGNARSANDFDALLNGGEVDLIVADSPYNLPIQGHVTSNEIHPEFHEASGEMTNEEYENFLVATLGVAASRLKAGGLLYAFIDWPHMDEMSAALRRIGLVHKQLCVWTKEYPGMGSFYRSQHELIYVAKKPGAPHVNNIQLGAHGRNRSNVWQFPGATGGQADEIDDFKVHPTVKPVRLIEEILLDVTGVGDYVLDPFLGSGSTLLAAERLQRRCLGLEIAPAYVDVAIQRWESMTGQTAIHLASGETFTVRANALLAQTQSTQGEV